LLQVKVHPRSRRRGVEKIGEREYRVRVLSPPSGGRANREVVALIAEHFGIPSSRVKVIRGQRSRQKVLALEAAPEEGGKQRGGRDGGG